MKGTTKFPLVENYGNVFCYASLCPSGWIKMPMGTMNVDQVRDFVPTGTFILE